MPPDGAAPDLLAAAQWHCLGTEPGAVPEPSVLPAFSADAPDWLPIAVPGTAASAVQAGGASVGDRDFDAEDWWFRTAFAAEGAGPWRLNIGGLASVADVWLNGEHVLHSENMFRSHTLEVPALQAANDLVIRCAALNPLLAKRRPRPRWKVARLRFQTQRWYRTTLLGRLIGWVASPAPVGPWRPITLTPHTPARIEHKRVTARCAADGPGGSVSVRLRFAADVPIESATVTVAGVSAALELAHTGGLITASGSVQLEHVERWWPHTHGTPARYEVTMHAGGREFPLGQVGFRELTVDRADGAFQVLVNGVEVFCRGAYWTPLDPVSLVDDPAELRAALEQVRAANLNMIRIGGETVYPDETMLNLLDELGIMLWQDCMFAFYDLPEDEDLAASIRAELSEQFGVLQPHPCLAVLSGGGEIEQQAAFTGISAEQRAMSAFETAIPELAAELLDGVTYIPSSPTGGALPIQPRTGVAHYYGVGAYLRGVDDARRAGVRFAAECLAFATPPEPGTVEQACGGAARAGHHPQWKAAVYRDAGASWDFEDVREHYTRELFGVEPSRVRWTDPERALDLGRATVAHLFEATWSEWRRAASTCSGALVFHYRDLAPGAGLGVVDALGRPKAPWYVMRRVLAPVAVLITDEGLNGLDAHVFNDHPEPLDAVLRVELFAPSGLRTESVRTNVSVPGHASTVVDLSGLFEGFRDLSYAHLFGPPAHDVLTATLCPPGESSNTGELGQAVFVVGGQARAVEQDLGLTAELSPVDTTSDSGTWQVTVRTQRFAQWVNLDVDGFIPSDNWFHLAPESSRTIALTPSGDRPVPRGRVGALNVAASRSMSLVREA